MAQTGFTPIQIYRSSTASAAPTSGNLVAGELAINTADGKLFYLDNLNAVQVIGWKLVPATAGGTGLSSYTTGDTLYSSATNTLAKLAIGTTGQVLTVAGGIPTWAANVSAAGSNRQIQFNNAGAFGADSGFVYNASGNVGIGVIPSNNDNFSPTLQIKNTVLNSGVSGDRATLAYNYDRSGGANTYISNGFASYYSQLNSVHSWHTAPSGTAGGTITFTQAMTLHASGGLSIGNTSDAGAGNLSVTGIVTANNVRSNSTTIASASTITPTSDTTNQYTVTALAVPATIAVPSGSPIDGQKLSIRIKDDGTARALTWTTSAGGFRVIGTTLPTITTASKVTYVGCVYNSQDSCWDVLAVATQA